MERDKLNYRRKFPIPLKQILKQLSLSGCDIFVPVSGITSSHRYGGARLSLCEYAVLIYFCPKHFHWMNFILSYGECVIVIAWYPYTHNWISLPSPSIQSRICYKQSLITGFRTLNILYAHV